jgi:hypothetical protein
MRLGAGAFLLVAVALACGPPTTRPPPREPPPPPSCDRAQAQYEQVLAAQASAMEGAARDTARERLARMAGVTGQRCREDEWSAEVTQCLIGASSDDEQKVCLLQMRADQHRRWFLHMLTGQVPSERLADEKLGPSCLAIEANYTRLLAGAAPDPKPVPDDVATARAWVARIFFERCVTDNWPEPARSCFGLASGTSTTNTCLKLLPETARTALHDHLVDMAESLGVPY